MRCDGARHGWSPDEYRHCSGRRSGPHGARDAAWRGIRTSRVSRRQNEQETLCHSQLSCYRFTPVKIMISPTRLEEKLRELIELRKQEELEYGKLLTRLDEICRLDLPHESATTFP